ncbi:hypothetical protein BC943DRAFT_375929 [Umbelopsis sp. AD052]|nr:hypothetical protein BC943DRAFT_375929 [Umbelopsis sp. AD052]
MLITGGGPAGLALAQYLMTHSVPFRIVEKASEYRLQGYSVALFWYSLYYTSYGTRKYGHFCKKDICYLPKRYWICHFYGKWGNLDPNTRHTYHCWNWLSCKSIKAEAISFGWVELERGVEVTGIELPVDGVVIAKTNKGDIMADIIVGADSLHSSIRQSIIGDKVEELAIMNLSGSTDINAEQYKALPNTAQRMP